jgi:multiple sugar transport system substrate-binding protein
MEEAVTKQQQVRALFQDAMTGRADRRQVIKRAAALGLTAPVAMMLAQSSVMGGFQRAAAQDRAPIGTFYSWMTDLHPRISQAGQEQGVTIEVAPTENFGIERFLIEAGQSTSTWDFYGGVTPFLEMIQLVDSGTIEPWDPYLPAGLLDDMLEAPKLEGMYRDQFYVWPLLLDITVQGWNAKIVEAAGLDPEAAPQTWDEYLSNSAKIVESGAADFGCVFDFHDWRSLIPITHSISTDVYTPDGLFRYNSDEAAQALELMKRMMEFAPKDILSEGATDGGVNATPDEQAFGAEEAAYYIKYQNAHLRKASEWEDPSTLRFAALPGPTGPGGTVFWDTGVVLFTHGQNKEASAAFVETLSNDMALWENSVTGNPDEGAVAVGQMPILESIWAEWRDAAPEYVTNNQWVFGLYDGMEQARAIQPSILSIDQFSAARPEWIRYLTGEESDPKVALQKAMDAVAVKYKDATGNDPQM